MRRFFRTKCIFLMISILVFSPVNIFRMWKVLIRYRCPNRFAHDLPRKIPSDSESHANNTKKDVRKIQEINCQVRSMGCFQTLPRLFVADMSSRYLTPNTCFKFCDDMGMLYVSLYKGHTCYCGENFLDVAILTMSYDCKTNCYGDSSKHCGGEQSSHVFMIISCNQKTNNEALEGCLVRTKKDTHIHEEAMDKEECLKTCENQGYTVAVSARKCICGHRDNVKRSSKGQACVRGTPYRTLAPDTRCDNKTLLPAGTSPPVALASFPGSGNTWFRQMIETATGVYTGSVYDEELIFTHGFIGEKLPADSGKTVVIKDHVLHSLDTLTYYESAILLIRDPYDAILAEYNRFKTLGHVASVGDDLLKSRDFHLFVNRKASAWKNTYGRIIRRVSRILPIYFEDAVKDAMTQIRRIIDFLPASSFIHDPDLAIRLQCLEIDVNGKFKRPKRSLTFDPYVPDLKRKINENIRGLRQELEKVNVSTLPKYERQAMEKKISGKSPDRQRNRQPQKIKLNAKDRIGN